MKTTKTIIDANVILRYLLNDSPEMSVTARNMIQSGTATFPEVVAEVVYVLLKVYKASREDIAAYIQTVLDDVEVERKDIMLRNCASITHTFCLSKFPCAPLSSVAVAPLRLPPPPRTRKFILRIMHELFSHSS